MGTAWSLHGLDVLEELVEKALEELLAEAAIRTKLARNARNVYILL